MIQVKCPTCGKEFNTNRYRLQRTPHVCCSFQCSYTNRKSAFAQRFWAKVNKATPTNCWLWLGSKKGEYGQSKHGGENLAHRIAWVLENGPIPAGLHVCHNCPGEDRKLCVNPAHLWLGTRKDNAADALAKGQYARRRPHDPATYRRGSNHPNAKITEADVIAMRHRHKMGQLTLKNLCAHYGLSKAQISKIVNGDTWKHVTDNHSQSP